MSLLLLPAETMDSLPLPLTAEPGRVRAPSEKGLSPPFMRSYKYVDHQEMDRVTYSTTANTVLVLEYRRSINGNRDWQNVPSVFCRFVCCARACDFVLLFANDAQLIGGG